MNTKALRQKILDLAIHGKLVPQDPNDEPASVLLERIKAEKERLIKEGKIKRSKQSKTACDKLHYPFELPDGWCWCKLEDLCEVVRGGSPRPAGSKVFYDGDIPFLKVADLTKDDEMYVYKAESSIKAAGLKKTRMVNEGTLLLTNSGATLGVPKITRFSTTFNDGIAAFLYLSEHIIPYIYWLLKSMTDSFRSIDQGAAQPNLNTNLIKDVNVPLPPIREQKRIVEKIKYVFGIIGQLDKSNDNLQETIKQAKSKILDLAIHGKLVPQDPTDEPASELLKRINPKAEITCDNPHYRKLPFEIPSTWSWCCHNDVLEISGGSQPAKRYFSTTPKIGHVRLYQIRDYGDSPVPVYIPIEYATKQAEKGDILLARYGGSLGKVFRAEKGAYNVAMAKIVFKYKELIYKEFAYYYYLSDLYQGRLKEISRTAQAGFNSSDFNEMYFTLPPYKEQQRIVNAINKAFTALDAISENL